MGIFESHCSRPRQVKKNVYFSSLPFHVSREDSIFTGHAAKCQAICLPMSRALRESQSAVGTPTFRLLARLTSPLHLIPQFSDGQQLFFMQQRGKPRLGPSIAHSPTRHLNLYASRVKYDTSCHNVACRYGGRCRARGHCSARAQDDRRSHHCGLAAVLTDDPTTHAMTTSHLRNDSALQLSTAAKKTL
jgi:hypothetical protein